RQIQDLAAQLPVLLDLRLGLRGAARELAVLLARIGDVLHRFLEARVIELQVDAQRGAQIGMPVGDHVYAVHGRNRVDVLQSLERFDRGADDGVLVRPREVLGGIARAVAPVARVRAHAGHAAVAERRIFRLAYDRARFFRGFHPRDLYAHDALVQH